jgi:hypothetical protein
MAASAACLFQTSNSACRCHQCSFRFLRYKHPPWLQHPSPKRLILQILKLHVQLKLHNPSLHCYVSHSFLKFLSPSPNSWLTCCNIIFSNLSALCFRNCCLIIQQLRMYWSWICYWWFSGVHISFPSKKNGESTYHEEAWDQAHMWDVDETLTRSFTLFHFKASAFLCLILSLGVQHKSTSFLRLLSGTCTLTNPFQQHKRHPLSSILCERVHNDFITTDLSTRSHCSNAVCTRITWRSAKTRRFNICHVGCCKIRCAEGKENAFAAIHLFEIHTLKTQPLPCCAALLNVSRRKGKEPRSNMTGCRAG